jgi:hypothetical protein
MDKAKKILDKYGASLREEVWQLLALGFEVMKKGVDTAHTEKHVLNILDNLERFLKSKEIEVEKIDFEVLMVAIFWHDVWKSSRRPATPWLIIKNQCFEGWGSARILQKENLDEMFDKGRQKKIIWAIRNHQAVKTPFGDSLESRILQDMDRLERWDSGRADEFFPNFKNFFVIKNKRSLDWMERWYRKWYMPRRDNESKYHFEWSKVEYKRRREEWEK